ncbi:unnamed protein product, partial [Brassica oleracea var. botrytis]
MGEMQALRITRMVKLKQRRKLIRERMWLLRLRILIIVRAE